MKDFILLKRIALLFIAFSCSVSMHAQINNGDLVITEIMNNPAIVFDGVGEWFEVYNPSSTNPINLRAWIIEDASGSNQERVRIDVDVIIPPNDFVVL